MKNFYTFLTISVILIGFISGCTSTTMIQSEPSGAKVYLNEQYVGNTPYAMSDQKIMMSVTRVRIEKDGYKPIQTLIIRDEEIDAGAAVAGFFLYFPWLWVMKYQPVHNYMLTPDSLSNGDELYYFDENYVPQNNSNINQPQNNSQSSDKAQKLREIKQLYDEGILTKEEYELQKQKILNESEW